MTTSFQTFPSPIGQLFSSASDTGLLFVGFELSWRRFAKSGSFRSESENPILERARRQLREYFDGRRNVFDLPVTLSGTPFQQSVWASLASIPFGTTVSYSDQAARLGWTNSARAIGRTNGLNPISIILPCHRVVGKNGSLTGYAGGLSAKKFLLEHEAAVCGSFVSAKDRPISAIITPGKPSESSVDSRGSTHPRIQP